jgi:hypothetical protein
VPREGKREVGSVGEFEREDLGFGELKIEYIIFNLVIMVVVCLAMMMETWATNLEQEKWINTKKKSLFILTKYVCMKVWSLSYGFKHCSKF